MTAKTLRLLVTGAVFLGNMMNMMKSICFLGIIPREYRIVEWLPRIERVGSKLG